MKPIVLMVLGVWIGAVASAEARSKSPRELAKRYDGVDATEIVWGKESEDEQRVDMFDPPFLTYNPNKVEVLDFIRYTNLTWQRSEPLTRAWRASLPEGVEVRRNPQGMAGNTRNPSKYHWLVHRRVYFAGLMLGREANVHQAIVEMTRPGTKLRLDSERRVPAVARRLGIAPEVFERWYHHPEVARMARIASRMDGYRGSPLAKRGLGGRAQQMYPVLLINGKYLVDATVFEKPDEVYRIANRIIRREMEVVRSAEWPTNDAELAEWMAPRSGEILKRVFFEGVPLWSGVYSHARREFWGLGKHGRVQGVFRVVGDGDESFFEKLNGTGDDAGMHLWSFGRQFLSFEGEHGPQRYGAFLLTDYLSAPDTYWVSLAFKGRDVAMAFSSDGKVEARNDKGSLFGSWWLEAGDLSVSFGELGTQSWPWQEVAERVGFDVPRRSLTPWLIEEGHDSGEEAKNRSTAAKSLSSGGIDSRGR